MKTLQYWYTYTKEDCNGGEEESVNLGVVSDGSGDNSAAGVEESDERDEQRRICFRQASLLGNLKLNSSFS